MATHQTDDVVYVRLIGPAEAADTAVERISEALRATDPSPHLPSRKNPRHVRVHFEVIV